MFSRRVLLSRLGLLAAGGAALWLVRDRIPWPPPRTVFDAEPSTPWIPLPRDARLIEIEGRAAGHPVRIVVDSGAQFSAIDRTLAQALELPQAATLPMLAYGVSGQPSLTHTVRFDLALEGLAVQGMRAAVLDIAGLAAATGREFHMLLGRDVLRELVLEADFPRDRVRFHRPEAYRPPPDARPVALKLVGGAPMTPVSVEGSAPVDVLVDTGASGVLALSTEAARSAGLLAPGRRVDSAHSVSLGGISLDQLVRAETVEAAGLTLRGVDVQIYAPSAKGAIPPGLLGSGLFRRYRMALDLDGGRLFLIPAAASLVREPRP
ncbi:aspartyl protease family protein [Phenylobacterium sp. J426]|uniref:aspartyl protease family protein n=1 Tax=Phenylobacterium sp. J426 TaxID=2898439 RepID=UPI00215167E6|nr:aspartyl protease family protein [Phenylobacterium sp. J426]MCR5875105.1 aspartyl protease family protein [Phenylobacterium sp. J426]